ncbi:TetR/AcrR family transcriptional regulator [Thermoactinomyces mirandus]|uniref:TetR/AcrR family transcriptional regulator n=1 Tax=Thermoactinomyces mirandus TaxID=2756294 RepID=A0A7W1XRQ4_9BACL|nr:TetR/AcrR family transcriptional regulator [Thermoactinomyces mirandus]MBA4601905.1 TetR/AcrR family transcriptional regulator [Thermoactinomyces mirandus]
MPRLERREEILKVAGRLFSKKGYHGTTIRDISDACGILSGSLYTHIKTKEDLLYEITDRGAECFLRSIRSIMESDISATEKLRQAVRAHMRVIEANLEAATVFFQEWKSLSEKRFARIQAKRDQYETMWKEILEQGIRQGEFRDTDEKFARLLLLAVGNWVYQWYRPEGDLSAEEIADRFVDLLLEGLKKRT